MKLILGKAGSGKTNEVAKEVAKLTELGVDIRIISNELEPMRYLDKVSYEGGDLVYVTVNHYNELRMSNLVAIIMEDKIHKYIFVDACIPFKEKDLKFLTELEQYTGKTLYICVQTNANSSIKVAKIIEGTDINGTNVH